MPCPTVLTALAALWLAAPPAPGPLKLSVEPVTGGANLLPNASFEQLTAGVPTGWRWSPRNTDATMTVTAPGRSGQRCLKITNGTAFGAHVYGQLTIDGSVKVKPSTTYTLSFYCRTEGSPGSAWVGGATGWRFRVRVPDSGGLWQRVSGSFTTEADETSIPLMINTDSPTKGLWIDDLQLEPGSRATPFDAPDTRLPASLSLSPPTSEGEAWKPDCYPRHRFAFCDQELTLTGELTLPDAPADGAVTIELLAAGAVLAREQLGSLPARALLTARYLLPAAPPNELQVTARLAAHGATLATAERTLTVVPRTVTERLLAAAAERLPALDARAASDDWLLVTATTVRSFLGFCREDLAHRAYGRAYDTAVQLDRLLTAAETAPPRGRAPRYVTSPLTIAGPTFRGRVKLPDGQVAERPVWFVGYGHFGAVRRDVERFPAYGANIFQVEFGPNSVLPAENRVSLQPVDEFLKLADRAAAANVQINLLLSPHYFPQWALQKWPYLKDFSGGFLQYSVYAPEARGVIEQFLRTVIPKLKDHPALHSVCLSNEPVSVDLSRCRYARQLWHDWLRQRFGDVAAANARWGTQYASLDVVPVPPPKLEPSALNYDFTLFNQEVFAAWHRWMADVIHSLAPQLPVHAKIMMSAHFHRNLHGDWSIAPELFAALSQIHGNDCCKWPGSGDPRWSCDWVGENMGYDYQRSAADLPVFNSENHLILDRDVLDVSPDFIRNVYWQGAIHGQGATTTWVWERTYDPRSDFVGSILHRPECVEAAGRTALDLNAAANEVAALASLPAPVAVLWSQATNVWRFGHDGDTARIYTVANFLDQAVGFVNERDCAAYAAGRPNRAFGAAKVVLVPQASHVPPAVVAALRRFVAAGGRVIRFGECFTHDDAGRAVTPAAIGEAWLWPADQAAQEQAWRRLRELLPPRVPVGVWGVEARAAEVAGGLVLNLCNYRREPVLVQVPGAWRDALTGEAVTGAVTLPPNGVRLWRR